MSKVFLLTTVFIAGACSLLLTACKPLPQTTITMGAPQSALNSLVWLTHDLGYFTEQGIDLKLKLYPSGKRALAGKINGEVMLAATAETPFVVASFQHDNLCLYATMGQSDNEIHVLARRDRGIDSPSDLRGKTIATQKGSAVHFFLTSFLLYHHLSENAVDIRFMKAEQLPAALASGEIDAYSMREPFISETKKMIGADNLIEFNEKGLYTKTYNLVGSKDFVTQYPGAMQNILLALNKGANYAERHPRKSMEIISRRLNIPLEKVASLWLDMRLIVTMNQGLLSTLEEEAKWVVKSGLLKDKELSIEGQPDFIRRLDPIPLAEAVPYAVGLTGIASP